MSEDMIVGRKAIIEFLRIPLQLSMDQATAWRKICRWKARSRGFKDLFNHMPNNSVYLLRCEVETWFKDYARGFKEGIVRGEYHGRETNFNKSSSI